MSKTSSPIIIGDKEYHKYLIIWEDICGDSTIVDYNEFSKMSVAKINTEAYIFKKTDKYIWSFASYQNDNGEVAFGDRNVYPRSVIKKMIKI